MKHISVPITDEQHAQLEFMAFQKGITRDQLYLMILEAGVADAQCPALERPDYVPNIGGCKTECGHTEEEHIAFDLGVYDGEQGRVAPSISLTATTSPVRPCWKPGTPALK